MERLFAPWRMEYVKTADEKNEGCIFCLKPREEDRRSNLILHCDDLTIVMLNKYPYNSGHLMVIPRSHVASLAALPGAEFDALFRMTNRAIEVLRGVYRPDGFNMGMNFGRIAGAGIDEHIHVHIVPRWGGDTSFMPVLGETKVVSEHLLATYESLVGKF
ncbi:MAG: HIT domain-containing protein [Deltaproteobacteria bacterium]|nr:HIT domain-containing protein [Deltaproteobacteria bacterium]